MPESPLDIDLIAHLPQQTLSTRLRSPRGVTEYRFQGCLLSDYLRESGSLPREGAMANQYIRARAGDGFVVTLAMAELDPGFSDKQVLLATEQNGDALRSGIRLVVPGDDLGGRSVTGLEAIEVQSVDSVPVSNAPPSEAIEIIGSIDRPGWREIEALAAMQQTSMKTRPSQGHGNSIRPPQTFRGVLVWDLLASAGIRLSEALHEPFLRKVVVARDADGYAVVVAGGEIEPRFQNAPFLVALSTATGDLTEDDGRIRLVAPFDLAGARSVKGLTSLELIDA